MRGADFMKEINNMDNDLIKEAENPKPKKHWNGNWVKVAAVAACVTVFVGGVAVSSMNKKNDGKTPAAAGNSTATSEAQEETTRFIEETVGSPYCFIPGVNTILTVEDFMEEGKTRNEYLNAWGDENHYINADGYAVFATDQVVMIDDMLYSNTHAYAEHLQKDVVDGTLTSSQLPNVVPERNGQANFGNAIDARYQIIDDNHIAIGKKDRGFDEQWDLFVAGHVGLEVIQESATQTGVSIEVTYTGKDDITAYFGEDDYYLMTTKEDGTWEYLQELTARQWSEQGYVLRNGDKYTLTVDWSEVYGELEPGLYHFVKDVLIGDQSVYLQEDFWVYADIEDTWNPDSTEAPSITEAPMTTWSEVSNIKETIITPVEGTITVTGGTFTLDYQKSTMGTCSEQYWIFKKNAEGVVEECQMIGELVLPDIAWELEPEKTREFTVDWSQVYGSLESGDYIIKKDIYYGDSNTYVYGEFTIE